MFIKNYNNLANFVHLMNLIYITKMSNNGVNLS